MIGKLEKWSDAQITTAFLYASRSVRESRKRVKVVRRQLLVCAFVCVCISIIAKFGVHESVKPFTGGQDCTEKSLVPVTK